MIKDKCDGKEKRYTIMSDCYTFIIQCNFEKKIFREKKD
jgi:hypothetical protein